MSADTKTPFDHVNDTVLQLKEMRHYAKNNVELLTTQWLLFDGELSKLKRASTIEQLMSLQGQFYDALETAITDLEAVAAGGWHRRSPCTSRSGISPSTTRMGRTSAALTRGKGSS